MDESQATEKKMKKAVMDETVYRAFCQLLGKERIPQRVVDEWAQFKVYADRLGVGTMPMPAYVMMFIAQRAGACPHIPVSVDVNGEVEPSDPTHSFCEGEIVVPKERVEPDAVPAEEPTFSVQQIATTVTTPGPNKPYTGKKRGRPPGSGKKRGRPARVNEPEMVEAHG